MLMRSIKTRGGLSRGRGMTEQQRTVWLLSAPAYSQVNHAMQQMSGVCYDGSEQHQEVSKSRTNKDYEGVVMVMQYILPFLILQIRNQQWLLGGCRFAYIAYSLCKLKKVQNDFLCQTKISKVNPKYGVCTLHVNSWAMYM